MGLIIRMEIKTLTHLEDFYFLYVCGIFSKVLLYDVQAYSTCTQFLRNFTETFTTSYRWHRFENMTQFKMKLTCWNLPHGIYPSDCARSISDNCETMLNYCQIPSKFLWNLKIYVWQCKIPQIQMETCTHGLNITPTKAMKTCKRQSRVISELVIYPYLALIYMVVTILSGHTTQLSVCDIF